MIPEALFRTFLHDMKNNGALFFEMYFDETVTAFTDMLNGQVFPDKAEATRGAYKAILADSDTPFDAAALAAIPGVIRVRVI